MTIDGVNQKFAGAETGSAAPRELIPNAFYNATRRARDYLDNPGRASSLLTKAIAKASRSKESLGEVQHDLLILFRLLRAWVAGSYRDVGIDSMVLVTTAILYFVMPFDAVPDFIPALGFGDDIALILFVLRSIRVELDKFVCWETNARLADKA